MTPVPRTRLRSTDGGVAAHRLTEGLAALRRDLEAPEGFPAEVEAAATAASAVAPADLPVPSGPPRVDRTGLPFVTIDPAGAMDLDQALHLERSPGGGDGGGEGFTVHYAIADVAAFVEPGGPVDVEAHRRGETWYGAGSTVPLHPPALSEGGASLLPDQVRPALLWTLAVDGRGRLTDARVERALVRSRGRLSYDEAQHVVDGDPSRADAEGVRPDLPEGAAATLALLAELGPLRMAREAERGGVSLPLPEQEVDVRGEHVHLEFRSLLPVEEWNAQVSLLTGIAAATTMLRAGTGLLRTLPPADPRDVERLRRTARALGTPWPEEATVGQFLRGLDPAREPRHAAVVVAATRLLRGSSYSVVEEAVPDVAWEDPGSTPDALQHGGLATHYAHATAPLRRLVDRYVLEACVALHHGEEVPGWVRDALPGLPATMRASGQAAGRWERGVLDLVEAAVLADRVGEDLRAVVVEVTGDGSRGEVTVEDPAVEGRLVAAEGAGRLPLGEEVLVRVEAVDVGARRVDLVWCGRAGS